MEAADVLGRVIDGPRPRATAHEIGQVLHRLSDQGFAHVRLSPPLVYHNDLSATVRRFYWSEDFGYALWLRLYLESQQRGLLPRSAAPRATGLSR